jgi:ubiquinone/menaquinone biosynthesis C-methylase UbiE
VAQTTSGIRSILSHPAVYRAFQQAIGSPRVSRELVNTHVRLRPGMRLLDVGCGPGRLVPFLPAEIEYTGLDLSEAYINAARKRYRGRNVRFFVSRVDDLDPAELGDFDVVVAKALLHHIDDDEAVHFFEVAARVLAAGGRTVTLDNAYTPDMSRAARFVVSRDRGQSVRTPEEYAALARGAFGTVDTAVHHDLMRIPYTHVFLSCSEPLNAQPKVTDTESETGALNA